VRPHAKVEVCVREELPKVGFVLNNEKDKEKAETR